MRVSTPSAPRRRQLLTEVCTENERRKQKEKGSEYFYRIVASLRTEWSTLTPLRTASLINNRENNVM